MDKLLAAGATQDVIVSISTSGDNTILAGVTGQKIRVLSLALTAASAVSLTIGSDSGGSFVAKTGAFALTTAPFILPPNGDGWATADLGKLLNFKLGGAVAVTGVAKCQVLT